MKPRFKSLVLTLRVSLQCLSLARAPRGRSPSKASACYCSCTDAKAKGYLVGHHARGLCTLSSRIGLQRLWPKVSHDAFGVRSALCEQASLEEARYHDNLQLFFMADLIDNSESSLLSARSLTSAEELVWRWIYTGSSDGGNLVSLVDGARRSLACLFTDECRSAVLYSCVCLKLLLVWAWMRVVRVSVEL